jgi:hypothetical protein
MPTTVLISISLYLLAMVFSLLDTNLPRLLLGTPFLMLEGFVLFKIAKRRHWARLALLFLVVYLDYSLFAPKYLSWMYTYFFGGEPQPLPGWYILEPLLVASVHIVAVACLFSKDANSWFRDSSLLPKGNEPPASA